MKVIKLPLKKKKSGTGIIYAGTYEDLSPELQRMVDKIAEDVKRPSPTLERAKKELHEKLDEIRRKYLREDEE